MSALSAADGTPQSVGDPGTENPEYFAAMIGATVDSVRTLALYEVLRQRLVRTVLVANPAAGADFTMTVPAGTVWELLAVKAVFTTSAAVANRQAALRATDGANELFRVPGPTNLTAGNGWHETWARTYGDHFSGGATTGAIAGVPEVPLLPGYVVASSTLLIDVADQWSAITLTVREWTVGQVYWAADLIGRELGYEHLNDLPASTPTPEGTGQPIPVSPLAR